jgi:hypothetical protein
MVEGKDKIGTPKNSAFGRGSGAAELVKEGARHRPRLLKRPMIDVREDVAGEQIGFRRVGITG